MIHPVRTMFQSKPAPRPVVADLVYHEEVPDKRPEFWTVRLYRDNFDSFSKEDQLVIFNWVSDIIRQMRLIQPSVYVEVFERMPR